MRRFSFVAAALCAAGMATAFLACSSVPDVTFGDGTSSSSSGSSGNEGGSDVRVDAPADAPKDVVSDCKATGPEDCFDGIDNDCNGQTDCADPACQPATQCVDPAPAGWTMIAFANATRPECPTGYDTPTDLKTVTGDGSGNCACACNPTAGTACNASTFSVIVDNSGCSTAPVNITTNTNCTALAANISVPNQTAVAQATPPAGPSACGATVTPSAGLLQSGRTCAVATNTKFGKCPTGAQLCAPKSTGFTVCVTKPGANACPAPYTKLNTVGADGNDQRTCNACTCEPKGCAGSVELFDSVDCTTGANKKTTGPIDTSCTTTTDKGPNFAASHYKTTLAGPPNGCGIDSSGFNPALTGNITWTDQRTVCCK